MSPTKRSSETKEPERLSAARSLHAWPAFGVHYCFACTYSFNYMQLANVLQMYQKAEPAPLRDRKQH